MAKTTLRRSKRVQSKKKTRPKSNPRLLLQFVEPSSYNILSRYAQRSRAVRAHIIGHTPMKAVQHIYSLDRDTFLNQMRANPPLSIRTPHDRHRYAMPFIIEVLICLISFQLAFAGMAIPITAFFCMCIEIRASIVPGAAEVGPGSSTYRSFKQGFLKRHPYVSFRVAKVRDGVRKIRRSEIKEKLRHIHELISVNHIPPDMIWNMDETGFCLTLDKKQKVHRFPT
jgi:hypothetical protein